MTNFFLRWGRALPLLALSFASFTFFAQGIGTPAPAASAALEVRSTTQGLLPPRLTAAQRAAVVSSATGLLMFQTDCTQGIYYYTGLD